MPKQAKAAEIGYWFRCTAVGRRLLNAECEALNDILPSLFGFHLLQMGGVGHDQLIASSRIRHRCVLQEPSGYPLHPCANTLYSRLFAYPDSLPFSADSMDVVLVHHLLEFADSPHAVLREVERVLIPEGHLVILSFNPFSFWGLWRRLTLNRASAPWCGHFISQVRLKDWLALLGFELVKQETVFFGLPFSHARWVRQTSLLERVGSRFAGQFGAVYILVARKRVPPLTLIRLKKGFPTVKLVGSMVGSNGTTSEKTGE